MVSNAVVIEAWLAGRKAEAGSLSTDGYNLYSYALLIGQGREVYDYTAKGEFGFKTKTTSSHVVLAKKGIANG